MHFRICSEQDFVARQNQQAIGLQMDPFLSDHTRQVSGDSGYSLSSDNYSMPHTPDFLGNMDDNMDCISGKWNLFAWLYSPCEWPNVYTNLTYKQQKFNIYRERHNGVDEHEFGRSRRFIAIITTGNFCSFSYF